MLGQSEERSMSHADRPKRGEFCFSCDERNTRCMYHRYHSYYTSNTAAVPVYDTVWQIAKDLIRFDLILQQIMQTGREEDTGQILLLLYTRHQACIRTCCSEKERTADDPTAVTSIIAGHAPSSRGQPGRPAPPPLWWKRNC